MKTLVIIANGFHLGYLGCYGNDWIATPALDRLAAQSVVFDQHYSDRPDAPGAHHAWRTGNYAFPSSGTFLDRSGLAHHPLDLLHLLQSAAIATVLIIDGEQSKEFASGWGNVYELPTTEEKRAPVEQALETILAAIDALADREDWLLWVETSALMPPWIIPDQFLEPYFDKENEEEGAQSLNPLADPIPGFVDKNDDAVLIRLQRTYAATVSYLDSGLEALFEELRGRSLTEKVMIVVTTDRGLPLGEHGIVGFHRPWLHDELLHLPLLVRLPGGAEAGRRISALTQPVDLMPTLLDAFGTQIPSVQGHSLLPLIRGEKDCLREYACSGLQIDDACELALRTKEWAFFLPLQTSPADPPRIAQLYVKPDDRWEVNNILSHHMDLANNFERVSREFVEATRRPDPLQAPVLEEPGLQPLGLAQSNE